MMRYILIISVNQMFKAYVFKLILTFTVTRLNC